MTKTAAIPFQALLGGLFLALGTLIPAASAIIASCGREHEGWLAWHTLATLAYIIERQNSAATERSFWIITRNESDFAASPVGALSPEAFLAHYLLP